jgi:hypothetical protein
MANEFDKYGRDRRDAYDRGFYEGLLAGMQLTTELVRFMLETGLTSEPSLVDLVRQKETTEGNGSDVRS